MNLLGSKILYIKYLKQLMNIFYSLRYTNEFLILNECSVLFLFSMYICVYLCVCVLVHSAKTVLILTESLYNS